MSANVAEIRAEMFWRTQNTIAYLEAKLQARRLFGCPPELLPERRNEVFRLQCAIRHRGAELEAMKGVNTDE